MAWTAPRTWNTRELVTKSIMDTHVRDNLLALKNPPTAAYMADQGSNYTTNSTSFVNVDGTNWILSITTGGGDVMVCLFASVNLSAARDRVYFDVLVDNDHRFGLDDGMLMIRPDDLTNVHAAVLVALIPNLSAGAHNFKLQWKVATGTTTATLYAGSGAAGFDIHPMFWAREVS